jgi:hypothetical protein
MLQVTDVWEEAKAMVGFCDDDKLYQWITDAIQLIANKDDFDGWVGYVDLCVDGTCVTLPREIETVLGVNIGGVPTLGRNQLFNFHLNGQGDCRENVPYSFQDKGWFATYRDILTPSKLIAFVDKEEDAGIELRVYGYDTNGGVVRQKVGSTWQDGWIVPTIYGYAIPDSGMPEFARITRVRKANTAGMVRLSTLDSSGTSGVVIGIYEPDEVEPWYRRIKLGKSATWIRLAYRKANPTILSKYDRIPLRSRTAVLLALKSLKFYREEDLASAHAFEVDALRLESEANDRAESPHNSPLQVVDLNNLQDKCDWEIV